MPHIKTASGQYYYEEEGEGDPLLMVPGFCCDMQIFTLVRKALSKRYRLILVENRGVGRSSPLVEETSFEDMAEDIIALLDHLKLKSIPMFGHSMGGGIILTLAKNHPERVSKLIFAQGFFHLSTRAEQTLDHYLSLASLRLSHADAGRALGPLLFSPSASEELVSGFHEMVKNSPYPPTYQSVYFQQLAMRKFDCREWVGKLKMPLLVLSGEDDYLCPVEEASKVLETLPNVSFHLFRGVGHMAHLEAPQEFVEIVSNFVGSTLKSGQP